LSADRVEEALAPRDRPLTIVAWGEQSTGE
jgi:hypothetical protein